MTKEPSTIPILRLERILPSNRPPHSELINAMKTGRIANSCTNIRAELLLDNCSHLPSISVGGDLTYCGGQAFSRTLGITQTSIRTLVAEDTTKDTAKVRDIDLDSDYDALILQQSIEEFAWDTEQAEFGESTEVGESSIVTSSEVVTLPKSKLVDDPQITNKDRVSIRVGEKDIIYLRLQEKEFTVHRTSILIPRLSSAEIEALLKPKREEACWSCCTPPRKKFKQDNIEIQETFRPCFIDQSQFVEFMEDSFD